MKRVAMARYDLPFPPSVNNLFANGKKGRFRTDRYESWRTLAGREILAQGRQHVPGSVALSIALVKPDKRRRDLSNGIKAIEDLLVDMGVIEDDSLVSDIRIRWVSDASPCTVIIQEHQQVAA